MKLSEIIAHVGDENILVEPLNDFLITAKGKPDHSVLTVRTGVMKASDWLTDSVPYVGLMVWIPKDKLPTHSPKIATEGMTKE